MCANGLARDVERYLKDEPVEACPPSAGYRLRKLFRRHKGPVLNATKIGYNPFFGNCLRRSDLGSVILIY